MNGDVGTDFFTQHQKAFLFLWLVSVFDSNVLVGATPPPKSLPFVAKNNDAATVLREHLQEVCKGGQLLLIPAIGNLI